MFSLTKHDSFMFLFLHLLWVFMSLIREGILFWGDSWLWAIYLSLIALTISKVSHNHCHLLRTFCWTNDVIIGQNTCACYFISWLSAHPSPSCFHIHANGATVTLQPNSCHIPDEVSWQTQRWNVPHLTLMHSSQLWHIFTTWGHHATSKRLCYCANYGKNKKNRKCWLSLWKQLTKNKK